MNRAWLFVALCGGVPVAAAQDHKISQRWAVLVGVDDYAYANDLEYCGADQFALFEQLKQSGLPEENVFILHTKSNDVRYLPTKANIERQLNLVFQLAEENDLLIVGFSGHGVHIDGKSYLCPADAELDNSASLISMDDVYDRLNASAAPFKLVIIDACRNDPRPGGARSLGATVGTRALAETFKNVELPKGVVLLNSCAPGEVSWEEKEFGHGVFMHYVLEGLKGGADVGGDGAVSLNELGEFVSPKTKAYVAHQFGQPQRPFFKGELSIEAMSFALLPVAGGATTVKPAASNPVPSLTPRNAAPNLTSFTNSIGMKFNVLPPGEFLMGSPEGDEAASNDEKPQHRVQITKAFAIGVYEVTVGQYRTFSNAARYSTVPERLRAGVMGWVGGATPLEQRPQFTWRTWWANQTDEHPVVNITYEDALAFCDWLSRTEGKSYRLPTEAEWEYACRAGTTTRYIGGDDDTALQGKENIADASAKQHNLGGTYASWDDSNAMTASVGSFAPNAFGLFDMNGNARELCSDWYGASYYASSPAVDPQGPPLGEAHVVRGGGWLSHPGQSRSARRFHMPPPMRTNASIGFRVVRD